MRVLCKFQSIPQLKDDIIGPLLGLYCSRETHFSECARDFQRKMLFLRLFAFMVPPKA